MIPEKPYARVLLGAGEFSRTLYLKHRERHVLVGAFSIVAFLMVRTALDGVR